MTDGCYKIKMVSATSGADRNGDGTISTAEADERQNFANWYSFYRTRNLMTISAASLAMKTLPGTIRVAWQSLNSCNSLPTSTCKGWDTAATGVSNAVNPFSGTHKTDFYTWLIRLPTYSSTPLPTALERVGSYCASSAVNNPTDKNTRCRKNYHLMMTDGIWNVAPSSSAYGNYDSTGHTLPDGKIYSSQTPYKDGNSNSLADVAFYYWAQDLVPSSDNLVSASFIDLTGSQTQQYFNAKNDPAIWQHLVNYTVGLALTPFLTSTAGGSLTWGSNTYDGSYPAIVAGTTSWPVTGTSGPDGNAADLWHAAIDSRGRFYNVEGPKQLSAAFNDIINTISSAADAGGGSRISTNVARTTDTGATAFVARFNADWSGTLQAIPLNATTGTLDEQHPEWEAGVLIPPGNLQPPAKSRKIFTRNSTGSEPFATCGGNLKAVLDKITKLDGTTVVDNLCPQRLAWLRGYIAITGITRAFNAATGKWQATYTAPNHGFSAGNIVTVSGVTPIAYQGQGLTILSTPAPTTNTFTVALTVNTDPGAYVADEIDNDPSNDDRVRYSDFRDRALSVLGDIVNSGTTYVHKDNFGYGGDTIKVGGQASYKSYVDGKASNPPVVYVGANDGMLHAFNAKTTVVDGGGTELFAYVPYGVYGNLSRLTDPNYGKSHKFFVDGTPTVGDVYLGSWKTYLVGGLRAGGKSIYALDITDPVNFGTANVRWEFNDSTDPLNPGVDMGLTFSQPQIAAVSLTQWAAIFGNGYNSTSGNAVLYIIDISSSGSTITPIAKITVPTNSTSCGSALPTNGLSTPFLFDKDGDGVVDVIYAGDLLGHLWRFDKSSGSWAVGNGGAPLFTACSASGEAQSIIAQPKAALIDNKITVYVGTGRYLQADPSDPTNPLRNDLINTVVQSFYSIIDESDDPAKQGTVPRNKLLPQTITQTIAPIGPYSGSRTVTNNTASGAYSDRTKGCYIDFNTTSPGDPSERITSGVLIKTFMTPGLETRVIFVTSTPTKEPCEKSGNSWLMEVNTNCGSLAKTPFGTVDPNTGEFQSLSANTSISGIKLDTQTGQTGLVNEISWIGGPADKGVAFKLLPGTTGKVESVAQSDDKEAPAGAKTPKRLSWEQIQ
ncbi:MAG: PilC/PilY family type IV pilus protein [Candidatus Competibacteraceae bacterium]